MTRDDRVYHGINSSTPGPARLLVEEPADGPTQRQDITVFGELRDGYGLSWGHVGSGPQRTAALVLADALGLGGEVTIAAQHPLWQANSFLARLRSDFAGDFLVHAAAEWRLPRGAVLRWVRGWWAQFGQGEPPQTVLSAPAATREPGGSLEIM
ncbi:hypothetical protein AB0I28_32000 [Phytomonospora sp. NPDC050363]|uniref:hypothetical protein n=1 Tax=Phytomonospora sp. NPDC050363 TaxID=3155642 RepID=UPI0033E1C49B